MDVHMNECIYEFIKKIRQISSISNEVGPTGFGIINLY